MSAQKESAKNYNNCEHVPLIPEKGSVLKHVSVMPLYLSLGIGLQFINIVENTAVSLDIEVREANGLSYDGIIESYNKQHFLEEEILSMNKEAEEISEQITLLQTQKQDLENENPSHFEKENGRIKNHSSEAKATRKQVNTISKEIRQQEEKVKCMMKIVDAKKVNSRNLKNL